MVQTYPTRKLFQTILVAGFAGALCIDAYLSVTLQFAFHTANAKVLSQWDASNALGLAAFSGGWGTAAIGFLMHWTVSTIWAAIYVLAAVRARVLLTYPIVCGALFGLIVRFVMIRAVVPLGHAHIGTYTPLGLTSNLIAHVVFFGVPVAWVAARELASKASSWRPLLK